MKINGDLDKDLIFLNQRIPITGLKQGPKLYIRI